jgi:hypothetical protein
MCGNHVQHTGGALFSLCAAPIRATTVRVSQWANEVDPNSRISNCHLENDVHTTCACNGNAGCWVASDIH